MFERFTHSARKVIIEAEKEAKDLDYGFIGAENLLSGIIKLESNGAMPPILATMGVTPEKFLDTWMKLIDMSAGEEPEPIESRLPFTPRAKKVIELALRESMALGHNYVGAEHLLLASIREHEGVGVKVLKELGVDLLEVRERTIESFSTPYDPMKVLESHLRAAKVQIPFLKEQLPKDDTLKRGEFERIEENLVIAQERLEDVKHLDT